MKSKLVILTVSIFMIGLSAQNFNDALRLSMPGLGPSARSLGMGNAFNSVSDDFSATIFNPAGLGLIKTLEFSGGMSYTSLNNTADFFNNSIKSDNSNTGLRQAGFVFPFPVVRGSMVFAIGYNQTKDFNRSVKFNGFNAGNNSYIQDLTSVNDDIAYKLGLSYPLYNNAGDFIKDTTVINGMLNQSGTIMEEGDIGAWSLSGAIEIAKDFYAGATLNLFSGTYNRNRGYYEDDSQNKYRANILLDPNEPITSDFNTFFLNDVIDWDISGWDFKIGFLYNMQNFLRLSGSVKFPTMFTIKENYFVRGSSYFANNQGFDLDPAVDDEYEYDIETPYEFTGGASVNIYSLIVSAEAQLIDYTDMEFTDGLPLSYTIDRNKEIQELFRSVINFRGGLEYNIPFVNVRVRGGFMYLPSPFEGDPGDFGRKYLTGGFGFIAGSRVAVDVGYAFGWWKDIGDNYSVEVSRTFQDIKQHNFMISIGYRF